MVINDYVRARALFVDTDVEVFKKGNLNRQCLMFVHPLHIRVQGAVKESLGDWLVSWHACLSHKASAVNYFHRF